MDHIGKTQPKRKEQLLSPKVKSAIKKRNRLRDEIGCKRAEWIQACQEVNEMIANDKESAWIEFQDDLEFDPDAAKVWSLIRNLSGNPDSPAPNEALLHNDKVITSPHKKADLFMNHYASLKMSNSDRKKKKDLMK